MELWTLYRSMSNPDLPLSAGYSCCCTRPSIDDVYTVVVPSYLPKWRICRICCLDEVMSTNSIRDIKLAKFRIDFQEDLGFMPQLTSPE